MDIWDALDAAIDKRSTEANKVILALPQKKKVSVPTIHITVHITRSGTYIEDLPSDIKKKIQNYYTLSDKTVMGYFVHTHNFENQGNRLYIPRFGSLFLKNKFKNITFVNEIVSTNPVPLMNWTGSFKSNQQLIFDHIMLNQFSPSSTLAGKAGLTLNLQAGFGKSFLAMGIIGQLKVRTLIVVHNSSILDQWFKLLSEFFPGLTIGKYYGKQKTFGDITIGIINSLVMPEIKIKGMSSEPREFFDKFDMVCLDESHEYCSASRRIIWKVAQAPYMMGLSATPDDRSDSLDKINHWGAGEILKAADLAGFTTADIAFKGRVTKIKYTGPPEYTEHIVNEKLGLTSVPLMIEQMCADPYRTAMIIDLIKEQHAAGMNVLVFADRRSYLETIRNELEKKSLVGEMLTTDEELREIKSMTLMGGSSAQQLELASDSKNIILSTFQYFSSGISVPKLDSVVLTTPRKTKSRQIIGRIFRLGSNYDIERQIIDVVDMKTSLKNQWQMRKQYYEEQKYTMVERAIPWKTYE